MEPRDVFISHVEEDWPMARSLAEALSAQQLTVWTYEEDGIPGVSHLEQSSRAIESCRAFVLLASPKSVKAHQVIREVEEAHEAHKVIIAVRLGLSHQEFVASNRILRMACGTAVTLAADEANLPSTAKRIAATLALTPRSVPDEQPSEALPRDAEAVKLAAPIESRMVAHTGPSGAKGVEVADVPRSPTVGTSKVPDESSSLLRNRTSVWLRFSVWVGIVVQIALGAGATVGLTRQMSEDLRWLLGLALVAAIGLVVSGLLLARSFARLWRSSGAKAMPQFASVRQLLTWSVTSGLVLSVIAGIDDTSLLTALILFVILFAPVALIWNGLRVLRKATAAMPVT